MNKHASIATIVVQYEKLLQRYARMMVRDEELASRIILIVFEDLYETGKLVPGAGLRMVLKHYSYNICRTYLKTKNIGISRIENAPKIVQQ